MLPRTIRLILKMMEGRYRNFPKDYLVVDVETTGVVPDEDLIVQVGHCLVLNGEPVDRAGLVLDWTRHPRIDQIWLRNRLTSVKKAVETDRDGRPSGKTYHTTYETLQAGVEPEPILQSYLDWFQQCRNDKIFIVAHNGAAFDGKFFERHFARFLGETAFGFQPYEMFDTGMCVKAAQASMEPWPEDDPRKFYKRVGAARLKGVKWALDTFCVPRFNLAEKYKLDTGMAHDAGHDCVTTHWLFQELKLLAATVPDPVPPAKA